MDVYIYRILFLWQKALDIKPFYSLIPVCWFISDKIQMKLKYSQQHKIADDIVLVF